MPRTEKEREYHKLYARMHRAKYPEHHKKIRQAWLERVGRVRRRSRRVGDKTCMFCEVKLGSKYAGNGPRMKLTAYCDSCRKNPKIKRYLMNLYVRRWRQKKKGLEPEPISFTPKVRKTGRPPKKSLIALD